MQVLYLGRAPRTKETLLDFMKWRRVTRHPLVFRGLTGSQRTPGFGASHGREEGCDMAGRARDTVRSALGRELCRDTQYCIVTEERGWPLGGCVTIQSLYRDKRAVWLRACHDTIDCIVTGGEEGLAAGCVAIQHSQGCDTARGRAHASGDTVAQACDTTGPGLRHGQAWPSTRRSVRAGWAGCVPGAPVLDSVHCF